MPQFVLPFSKLGKNSVAIAGGKGAQLGEMSNASIPVPPGFVVLTPSFDLFLERNGLAEKISKILGKVNVHETSSVDAASKEIRSLIAKGEIPPKSLLQLNPGSGS